MATVYEKIKLLQGLVTGEQAAVGPFFATVDITSRCNLKCPGCLTHSALVNPAGPDIPAVADISSGLLASLLHELAAMGAKSITFSGDGEPFLHPQLFALVALAKKAGLHVTLFTNGTLLEQESVRALIGSGLDKLRVSLWAGSREQYATNYPGTNPDTFDRIVDGLLLLSARKNSTARCPTSVIIHHPINRSNFRSLDAFIDLAFRTGVDGVSFSPLKTHGGKLVGASLSLEEEHELRLSLSRIKSRLCSLPLHHNIDQTLFRYQLGEDAWRRVPCYIPWLHARIKVDGTVLACNNSREWTMGRLPDQPFGAIWNGPAFRLFRRKALAANGAKFISEHADCGFCCHIEENIRVHRLYRWLLPMFRPSE